MRSTSALTLTLCALGLSSTILAQVESVESLRQQWNLDAADFSFDMPPETLDSSGAQSWIRKNWDLASKIDWGGSYIVFSPDPSTSTSTLVRRQTTSRSSTRTSSLSPSSTESVSSPASTDLNGQPPVLRINYPAGSYSKRTGGTQFYAAPLNSTSSGEGQVDGNSTTNGQYERMMLSYDVWFPVGFAWNKGGKLPGLRGGSNLHGCSGGSETDGTTCFSTRLMWRSGGSGEIYAYIPTKQQGFCSAPQITCNSDYGTSLSRGSFSFTTGQWQTITMVVVLNQDGVANGVVQLYYNGVQAMSFNNLVIRTSTQLSSIGGLFFSTFFGGDDTTWSTPTSQYAYFRNMRLYAGYGAANGEGAAISAASRSASSWGIVGGTAMAVVLGLVGIMGF